MQRAILFNALALGVSAIVTQMLLLRECLSIFAGNELVIAMILANWLLLTGLGSFCGRCIHPRRNHVLQLIVLQTAIALLPLAAIIAIRLFRAALLPGASLGLGYVFITSFVLLLPFCATSGFLLIVLSRSIAAADAAGQIGAVYVADMAGGILGGIMFAAALVLAASPIEIAFLMCIVSLSAALLLLWIHSRRYTAPALWTLAAFLGVAVLTANANRLEKHTTAIAFPNQKLLDHQTTPYGSLVLTQQAEQYTVYENGLPVGSSGGGGIAEEAVHFGMVQHPDPQRVLLISGGLSGGLTEVLKYSVAQLDYVELDPALLPLVQRIQSHQPDKAVRFIATDARRLLREADASYDVILLGVPDPASAQLNRFFTIEFFRTARQALRTNGILSLSLSSADNYANPEMRVVASSIHRTLQQVFPHILVLPGRRLFLLASSHELNPDIARLLEQRNIQTLFLHSGYLRSQLSEERRATAVETVSAAASINRDLRPLSLAAHLRYWLTRFGSDLLLPLGFCLALAVITLLLLLRTPQPAVSTAITASGFASMGLEVMLLIGFQIYYGYVYQHLSVIITAFLVGSAAGAAWAGRQENRLLQLILRLDAGLALLSLLLIPFFLSCLHLQSHPVGDSTLPILFPALNLLVGLLVGAQFPLAARLVSAAHGGSVTSTASTIYTVDFLGASLGTLLVGAFCIPLLGIPMTCLILGVLKLATVLGLLRSPAAAVCDNETPCTTGSSGMPSAAIVTLVFGAVGVLIVWEPANRWLFELTLQPWYLWMLIVLAAWGVWRAFRMDIIQLSARLQLFTWANYLGFALAAFYPVFRCYFKVPYLFCHVCPSKCIFGHVRPYMIPAALIMNLDRQHWCRHACPIGTLHDCQAGLCTIKRQQRKGRKNVAALRAIPIAALIFTAVSYFKIRWDAAAGTGSAENWYTFFFQNRYAVSGGVLITAAVLLTATPWLRRPFCSLLCPLGKLSELLLRKEERVFP